MLFKKNSKQDIVKPEVKVVFEKIHTDSKEDVLKEELNCPQAPNLSTRSSA